MTHILIPREPSPALLRPFIGCNTQELHEAWAAMIRIAEVQHARAGSQCLAQIEEAAGAASAAVSPQGERQWICPTRTVADLVNNLLTMDQALPIYGAQYIEKDGRRCAIAVPPTVSRERVQDGRWIGQGEELNAAVVWTRAEQPVAAPGLTDGQLDDESYRVNDEPGFADAFRAGARFAERVHGVTASAARAVTGKADWWRGRADEIEVRVARSGSQEAMRCYTDMRTLLQAAAPALEAPPAVTGRTVPRNDDERAAAQFFADNPGAALLAWPLYFARDKSPALEAPAAPVGSARQFIEWMYSQPEDREPTTAEGALLEFEAHLAAAAPQAPAAPVHSKTYSDGTVATGSGELPAQSPQQQVLCTLLDTVEAMLGGANGPTIQIRAALLAAPAAPVLQLPAARAGRIYVAGPMSGLPDHNFPAFNAAAAALRANGWHVENPAEHGIVEGAEWADYLHYDMGRLATCSAVHLLPGWSKSRGAALEVHVATTLGMVIFYAEGAEHIEAAPAAPAVDAWLQPDDMAALQRFHETAEDDESYDIGKEAVARLCAFGCLQSHSFGRYSTTDFGDYLLDTWAGARTLPFTTAAERAAQAAAKGEHDHG